MTLIKNNPTLYARYELLKNLSDFATKGDMYLICLERLKDNIIEANLAGNKSIVSLPNIMK